MESVEEKINRFNLFFIDRINKIEAGISSNDLLHTKILCCTILDSLAKSISENTSNKNNKKQFVGLVGKCANWRESQYISLMHLHNYFESCSGE